MIKDLTPASTSAEARSKARSAIWGYIEQVDPKKKPPQTRVMVGKTLVGLNSTIAYTILRRGISSKAIGPLSDFLGLGKGLVAEYLDLDRTTAHRRAAKDQPLPVHSAEGVLRLLELDQMATDTFETEDESAQWLRRPHPMLEGETPLAAAKTSYGMQRVKDILMAIKYGGVV